MSYGERTATITVSGPGVATQVIAVTQDANPVSVDEATLIQIKVYPNPTEGVLNLKFNGSADVFYRLIDLSGRTILTKRISNENETLDLNTLESGIYILEIHTAGEVMVKKIIKK